MTAYQLLCHQIDKAGFMLTQALTSISETDADFRIAPLRTPREQVIHLTDSYLAAQKYFNGEKYKFGSYVSQDATLEAAISTMFRERDAAIAGLGTEPIEDALLHADDFLNHHDQYHIGQLVILHHAIDPAWNHYSIYGP